MNMIEWESPGLWVFAGGAIIFSLGLGSMCSSTSSNMAAIEQCAESCDVYAPAIESGRCYCDKTKPKPTPRATPGGN